MNQNDIKKVKNRSLNITEENRKKIGELFPEVITESINKDGKCVHAIDFEKLKQLLSDSLVDERERYDFTWVGKNKAILEAGQPINKTLRPQKDKSVDWDNTENIYIEGDNLEVLKLLQASYLNKIDVIYIDPPYNTGNDFIYNDDFKMTQEEYSEAIGEFDEYNQRMKPSKKDNVRFHSDWLNMMYSRLKLARNLLSDDGVIFISIDDNEQAHLKELCDEIFGEENFIGSFIVENNPKGRKNSNFISITSEYCLAYAKFISNCNFKKIVPKHASDMSKDENGNYIRKSGKRVLMGENKLNPPVTDFHSQKHYIAYIKEEKIVLKQESDLNDIDESLINTGFKRYITYKDNHFVENTYTKQKFLDLFYNHALDIRENKIYEKHFSDMMQVKNILKNTKYDAIVNNKKVEYQLDLKTTSAKKYLTELFDSKDIFSFPKNISFIKLLCSLLNKDNSIILDFFSGSGTTADAVMQLNAEDGGNRKFIMVQLPEEIDEKQEAYKEGYRYITEIGEERIRRAGAKVKEEHPEVDTGFRVFKVDSSNMEETYKSPNEVSQHNLLDDIRNVKEDRNDLDLLYQVMLDWGLELSLPYESEIIEETMIHNVFDGALIACFADDLNEQLIRKIAEKEPFRVVFKDSSFKDSAMKTNVVEIFKEISSETKIKVI